jgi:hypothetical protein
MKMSWEQKKAHERLMRSLPVTTHFKKWPEARWGGNRNVKEGKWRLADV